MAWGQAVQGIVQIAPKGSKTTENILSINKDEDFANYSSRYANLRKYGAYDLNLDSFIADKYTDKYGVAEGKNKSKFIAQSIFGPSLKTKFQLLSQKKLRGERDKYLADIQSKKFEDIQQQGAIQSNMIPEYSAPAYGRCGMKIKTMFNGGKMKRY